jgi:hypothetical protein
VRKDFDLQLIADQADDRPSKIRSEVEKLWKDTLAQFKTHIDQKSSLRKFGQRKGAGHESLCYKLGV